MANSTITKQLQVVSSSGVTPFGIGQTIGAFSVQFTNYGPGILAVGGSQSTFTSLSSVSNAVLVYPGQVSPVFWSSGATENDGTSDLCMASMSDQVDYTHVGATVTVIG